MNRGGLCETCLKPGNCCREVWLRGGTPDRRMDHPMSFERAEHAAMAYGLPFRPLYQLVDKTWMWWCTGLDQSTGRCTIYEDRPQLCRDYRAGSDQLCVHYHHAFEEAA